MAAKWHTARIEDIAERVAMGPFGSAIKVETFVAEGIPVISGQHLRGFNVDDSVGYNFVTEEHANQLKKANVQRGDVIFTHAGNIGQVAVVPQNATYDRYVISQRQFYMRCSRDKVLPEYVVAYFKSPAGQHKLRANASQVGVPSIAQPVTYLRSVEIPLPPISVQQAIVSVLSGLDEKIEHNRHTARALERLARAIFRAWFVDFEPVKAKAGGATSFPPMPQTVFDDLPSSVVDSEIGPVPEGWEIKPVSEAFEINPTRSLRKGQPAPYLDMKNMPTSGPAPDAWVDREFGSGMKFMNGDTLLARITPCLENGKTAFVDFLDEGQVGWGSTEYIVLRPKPPLPPVFGYCLARSTTFREHAIQNMTGTSGRQRVASSAMHHYQIAVASKEVAAAFADIVQPMFETIRASAAESRKLAELRDYLLPKLLSGDVRVALDASGAEAST